MNIKTYDSKMFRLTHILKILNESGTVKTSELAKEFNISPRTIQRDIQLLESGGFPLVAETKEYRFVDGFALDKVKVTHREKFLLTILFRLFININGPLRDAAKGLIDKILVVPKVEGSEEFSRREKVQLLRKFDDISKDLEVGLQKVPKSKAFKTEIHNFLTELKNKIEENIYHNNRTIKVTGKGKKIRIQKIPQLAYDAVMKFKNKWTTIFGRSQKSLYRELKAILVKAEVQGSPHTFRDTFATYSIRTMPLSTLRERMGHCSLVQTDKYTHALNSDVENEILNYFKDWQIAG